MTDGRLWTFADFKIRDILDVDLVSTTYRATTVEGNESRRLRVFAADVTGDSPVDLQAAVIAEAREARHVRHPHILATHDADRHGDRVYVVSDDIHGVVLRDYIADHQPFKPATALAMGWQLAEALDAVHARGIVHGSINPHTIWVADSPGRDVPMIYLTGFGSARVLAQHVMNQNGAPTSDDLLYVGPDQIRDERGNPEADRYALACAIYHVLTGVPPFRRGSVNALLGAHLFSAVEPPSSVRDDLPSALDSVFARALAKETSDRYPSASSLMIAVERGLSGQEDAGPLARRRRSSRATAPPDHEAAPAAFATSGIAAPDPVAPPDLAAAAGGDAAGVADAPTLAPDEGLERDHSDPLAASDPTLDDTSPLAADPALDDTSPLAAPDPAVDDARPVAWSDPAADDTRPLADPSGDDPDDVGHSPEERARAPASAEVAPDAGVASSEVGGLTTEEGDDGADPTGPPAGDAGPAIDKDADRPAPQWVDFAALWRGSATEARPGDAGRPRGGAAPGLADADLTSARAVTSNGEHAAAAKDGATIPDDPGAADTRRPATREDAGTLEARRAARELHADTDPTLGFPSGPPVAFPLAPSAEPAGSTSWRSDWRGFVEARRGVLAVVAGGLVVAAAVAAAFVTLRGEPAEVPSQPAAQGSRGQPATIRPLWTTPFATRAVHSIEVTDDAVLIEAGTTIGALEPASGAELWTDRTRVEVTDVAAVDDVMIVRTGDRIRAYEATTGATRWTLTDADVDAMEAGGGQLYAVANVNTGIAVSAIDPVDGGVDRITTIPARTTAGEGQGRLALAFDSGARKGGPTLYILTRAALYALDPDAGSVRWRAPVRDEGRRETPRLRARPWVQSLGAASGAAFVVDEEGRICRHAAISGEQVWTTCQKFPTDLTTAPTLLARGGRVTVASSNAIAAYDYTNGLPLWKSAKADGRQAAVAAGPGMTYVAWQEDVVQALDGESGRGRWRAPDIDDVTALAADDEGVFVGRADGGIVRLVQRTVGQADIQ